MIKAVLLDLDNTLLGNDMRVFLPQYFKLCGQLAQRHLPADEFMRSLLMASRTMVTNTDPAQTNNDVFWNHFCELTNLDGEAIAADFEHFYRTDFEKLREFTEPTPVAAQLVDYCLQRGLRVVIATNPMFPRVAIDARLAWAGIPADKYPYALVTAIENMHATKPNQAYYEEILGEIDHLPHEALMVGDDGQNDIEPAVNLGLYTYWIRLPGGELPPGIEPTAQGTLAGLLDRMEDGWLLELETAA